MEEFNQAASSPKPGTRIILANGIWKDVEFRMEAYGNIDSLISIEAQEPGKVFITGHSNLSFSGEYIHVTGLVFKDGYTPTSEVISLRTDKEKLANNCRVSNCVIDNYTNPERFDGDTWVAIYGKNNRFDHNSLVGKGNVGVTLAVKLNTKNSLDNNHVLEYNYFGPRQVLGSNGGESLRVGTSHYSREYSNTIVRNNYFDRCNGEHEIISNKACGNKYLNNVFFECQGTLTMRHGHHTTVENNYFLGNYQPNTGGIRIINEYQTVEKNYLHGLTGHRFRGALVIMNGVPNSPINRYNQVVDSYMNSNVVLDCDYIQLCAGSDEERSAIPIGSTFKKNLIYTGRNHAPFTIYDDVSGIEFSDNIVNTGTETPFGEGFSTRTFNLSMNEEELSVPPDSFLVEIGFDKISIPVKKEECGASFYLKYDEGEVFGAGETTKVSPGTNTLLDAIVNAKAGDILELESDGVYLLTKYAIVDKAISIISSAESRARILSEKQSFFKIENGGALYFKNVIFDGHESPDQAGNNVISTSNYSMNLNYSLVVEGCEVLDLDKNHSFNFFKTSKHTFADSIVIKNTSMHNITGSVISLATELEDLGIYNAENVKIENCNFTDVQGVIADIYRGGTDESTFGPIVSMVNVEIQNCGHGKRNKLNSSLRFHGVQKLQIDGVQITSSKGINLHLTNGEPISNLANIHFVNSDGLTSNSVDYQYSNITINNK